MTVANTIRNGRFVLLQPIGEGAQGRTFAGIDTRPPHGGERPVAIKRFEVRGATSWKDVELAEREARVLQSLSHPKLPTYVDHFEEDGALYLVMEKIEGESLASYRKRGAVLSEGEIVRLLRDASDVLDYLHGRAPPVIHRDLKPGNVIRRPDGSFAFVDFGAVRDKLRPKGGSTVVGTFGYMAPEQVQGRALPASDVYAIGATALAMLSGCEPEDLPHRGLGIDVRAALRGRNRRLVGVLERMLEPDPDRRASRIAPLLVRPEGGMGDHRREVSETLEGELAERYGRHAARRARRAARRAGLRAERAARRASRGLGPVRHGLPWPARLFFALLFTLGIVAVSIATQIVVPLILRVLSLFVARRPLAAAADATRHAGEVSVAGMRAARRWAVGGVAARGPDQSPQSRVRVDAGATRPVDEEAEQAEAEAGSEDSAESARRRGQPGT